MRLHPIVSQLFRVAGQDEVIPLQHPIVGRDGQHMSSIPVRQGQVINVSVAAYNRLALLAIEPTVSDIPFRNTEVWGSDAAVWNPERFMCMDKRSMVSLGPYANVGNFCTCFTIFAWRTASDEWLMQLPECRAVSAGAFRTLFYVLI